MFAPSTFGSTKNISGLASPVSVPIADVPSGLVTVTALLPLTIVPAGMVTVMFIESVTVAETGALSTVTVALGLKFVPVIVRVMPSEHSGFGSTAVTAGASAASGAGASAGAS